MKELTKIDGRARGKSCRWIATTRVRVDSTQSSATGSLATGEGSRAKLIDLNGKIN